MAVRVSHVELATPRLILGRTLNRDALGLQLSMERVRIGHVEEQEGTWARRVRVPSLKEQLRPSKRRAEYAINRSRSVEVRAQQLVELPRLLEVGHSHPNAAEPGRGDGPCIHVGLLVLRAFGVCRG